MATPHKSEENTVDYSKWEPAGLSDKRSPCPLLNSLANHHILPHDGRGITKAAVIKAIHDAINLDTGVGNVFASIAMKANPENTAIPFTAGQEKETFDLDQLAKHGLIEHDVSLSRNDYNLGDNVTFDDHVWEGVLASYGDRTETDFHSASKARWDRVTACKTAHKAAERKFEYGIKEMILSYGETALMLSLLGDPKDGKIPIQYLRTLFEEEKLPIDDGWKKSEKTITQPDLTHLILSLIAANEHKTTEATDVGLGTVSAVTSAVQAHLPSYCTIM